MMYRNLELADTVDFMESDDWKERLVAEYWQTKIRYEKLHRYLISIEAGTLDRNGEDFELMTTQCRHMGNYLHSLEVRMEKLDIDFNVLPDYAESKHEDSSKPDFPDWQGYRYGVDDDDDGDLYIPVRSRKKKC